MTRQLSILRFVTCKIFEFLCLFTNNQNQFFSELTSVVAVFLFTSACFLGDFVTKTLARIFALVFGIFHVSPAMVFTLEQRQFMVEAYFRNGIKVDGVWTYSVQAARYDYLEQFPNDFVENKNFPETLQRCLQLFRETGSVARKTGSGRPSSARTPENIDRVREVIENQPKTSVRHLSQQVGLSLGTCHTILKKDLDLYSYKMTAVQELKPPDLPLRTNYCQWFMENLYDNPHLLGLTFFTDEAWFYKTGYINSQNMRIWSAENPHEIIETPLHPEKVGVWAAISARRIIGPIFFDGNINARRYQEEILRPFFEELHDDELQQGYFQQDGATPHCTQETLELLREYYADRVISRNTDIPYPPRSCDLTPCDFFLWPHLKNSIFSTPVNDLDELCQRITNKIEEINNNPRMLQNVSNSVRKRVSLCIEVGGGHVQHLL